MIGTPNAGSPAETNDACAPAVFDFRPGANATKGPMNPNTKYYTIAGDWMPLTQGNLMIQGNDDGLVPVESVESQEYFQSLGQKNMAMQNYYQIKNTSCQKTYYLERSRIIL